MAELLDDRRRAAGSRAGSRAPRPRRSAPRRPRTGPARRPRTASTTSGLASCSGARNTKRTVPSPSASSTSRWSPADRVEFSWAARPARSSSSASRSTWSRCRAISGETTTTGPSSSCAGDLVDRRLPGARGQDGEGVAPGDDGLHRLLLAGPEARRSRGRRGRTRGSGACAPRRSRAAAGVAGEQGGTGSRCPPSSRSTNRGRRRSSHATGRATSAPKVGRCAISAPKVAGGQADIGSPQSCGALGRDRPQTRDCGTEVLLGRGCGTRVRGWPPRTGSPRPRSCSASATTPSGAGSTAAGCPPAARAAARRWSTAPSWPASPPQLHEPPEPGVTRSSSARNRLTGIVTRVVRDTVMAQVEIQAGPFRRRLADVPRGGRRARPRGRRAGGRHGQGHPGQRGRPVNAPSARSSASGLRLPCAPRTGVAGWRSLRAGCGGPRRRRRRQRRLDRHPDRVRRRLAHRRLHRSSASSSRRTTPGSTCSSTSPAARRWPPRSPRARPPTCSPRPTRRR